jgi:hypothetical protein
MIGSMGIRLTLFVTLAALAACGRDEPPVSTATEPAGLDEFLPLVSPLDPGGDQIRLSLDAAGSLVASWLAPEGADELALKYARFDGTKWSSPSVVATGSDWVVSDADLPSVRLLTDRLFAADWRIPSEASPYAYDIAVAISGDAGATWSAPRRLNDDDTPTEHGFVSWFATAERRAGAVWLDGRGLEEEASEKIGEPPPGTSLRRADLSPDGAVVSQDVIDALVCDCCRTDVAEADGGVAVIYRDRSPAEIRDIHVRVLGAGESVVLGPDYWQIEGCPVNGPAIDARGAVVAAAWFTAADDSPRVRFARSLDGARTFGPALDIDTDAAIGQVGVALDDKGVAYVSWWRRAQPGGAEFVVRGVDSTGTLLPIMTVGTVDVSRPQTVPQIKWVRDRLVVAWTDEGALEQRVHLAEALASR